MYLIMLSVKQGGIKYHILSLCYGSIWDWILVFRAMIQPSTNYSADWRILFVNSLSLSSEFGFEVYMKVVNAFIFITSVQAWS